MSGGTGAAEWLLTCSSHDQVVCGGSQARVCTESGQVYLACDPVPTQQQRQQAPCSAGALPGFSRSAVAAKSPCLPSWQDAASVRSCRWGSRLLQLCNLQCAVAGWSCRWCTMLGGLSRLRLVPFAVSCGSISWLCEVIVPTADIRRAFQQHHVAQKFFLRC